MKAMKTMGTLAGGAVAVGFALAGVAAAQQATAPRIDVDELAEQLGLTDDVKGQIAPDVERLNQLLTRLAEQRREHLELRTGLHEGIEGIEAALTPEQVHRLRTVLRSIHGHHGHGMMDRGHGMHGHGGVHRHTGHGPHARTDGGGS